MIAEQKIVAMNTAFESLKYKGLTEVDFNSGVSLLDYDAVIINSDWLVYYYKLCSSSPFQGQSLLSQTDSHQIVKDFNLIKQQISECLKQGKNIYILLGKNENCCVYTGDAEYSGTGKNARRTNIVTPFDMYSFLPVKIKPTHVTGEKMEICNKPPYSDFFKKTLGFNYYNAFFDAPISSTLLKIPDSNKALAAVYDHENGKIIFLPQPYSEEEYSNATKWKKDARNYLDALFELNQKLSFSLDEYAMPQWTEDFSILDELSEQKKIKQDLEKLKKLELKIEKQRKSLECLQRYKTLVCSSGAVLEEIVKTVLIELGFVLSKAEKGRSDIIAKYEDTGIVAEIKGVSKSAAEKHAAQLEKWVSQYIEDNGSTPKPLLIVNGFCDVPVFDRNEDVFPHQMLKYCEARGHALITTTQLLCLYIEIQQNPECKTERISELLSCVGRYSRYQDFSEFLISKENGEK